MSWRFVVLVLAASSVCQALRSQVPDPPDGFPPPVPIEEAEATSAAEMQAYTEVLAGTPATLDFVPIPAGSFRRGSPSSEAGRRENEGPVHEVRLDAFWMSRIEIPWDVYRIFMSGLDAELRSRHLPPPQDAWADAVSRPTPPYVPMDFGMGTDGYPAIAMTQFAARHFTKWLSMKTGRFYRLPTEAEWEYTCRAGSETAYSTGDDPATLATTAWYDAEAYRQVDRGEPNAWGVHDLHGNVAEWTLDALVDYPDSAVSLDQPLAWPGTEYGRVVRGGSWADPVEELRCAARRGSDRSWKRGDPQLPQSIWFLTHAPWVGLRVVRPLRPPPEDERAGYWEPDVPRTQWILEEQAEGVVKPRPQPAYVFPPGGARRACPEGEAPEGETCWLVRRRGKPRKGRRAGWHATSPLVVATPLSQRTPGEQPPGKRHSWTVALGRDAHRHPSGLSSCEQRTRSSSWPTLPPAAVFSSLPPSSPVSA